ncbi:hypothetical protein [Aquimarina algiphila]|uniref:Uncharacterized protein n=1 Tax=Aquimarina algiphila TaxID=2047982 RepID=A0A554VKB6_9FLAO|nr:hypothetical protein [Aquimarina algiphila]TSE08412.1 hypothetical protein FOF46_12715 [Aquimarina algiphila]
MKLILFNIMSLFMTTHIPLEFLGKHINELPNVNTIYEGGICIVNRSDEYLGKPYENLYILTNNERIVQSFSIYIDEIINQSFYDRMVKEYGKPDFMYKKIETGFIKSEIVKNGLFETVPTKAFKMVDCEFNESPLVFTWYKEQYDIQVIIGDRNDTFTKTRIIFGDVPIKKEMNK